MKIQLRTSLNVAGTDYVSGSVVVVGDDLGKRLCLKGQAEPVAEKAVEKRQTRTVKPKQTRG